MRMSRSRQSRCTRRPSPLAALLAAALVLLAAAGCASRDLRTAGGAAGADTAAAIDLARFMGTWHIAAHVPHFGERGRVASTATYALAGDDGVRVRHRWRDGFGEPEQAQEWVARIAPDSGNRLWMQRRFKLLPVSVRILEVAPDYSWALVDLPDRELAWILTRAPVLDNPAYRELEKRIAGHGVNTDRLRRVPQVPQQVGRLGFAPPAHP